VDPPDQGFPPVGIAIDHPHQALHVRQLIVDGGLLAFWTLKHPARRAHMGEAHLPIVDQRSASLRRQSRGDIDNVDIRYQFREFGKRNIGAAEARAMPTTPAFGDSERLNCRFGQIVNQNRRRGSFPQLQQHVFCLGNIDLVWLPTRLRSHGQKMPRVERANQDGIMLVLGGESKVIGCRCSDPQVIATAIGLTTEKISLHVNITITEQDQVEPRLNRSDR